MVLYPRPQNTLAEGVSLFLFITTETRKKKLIVSLHVKIFLYTLFSLFEKENMRPDIDDWRNGTGAQKSTLQLGNMLSNAL